MHKLSVISIVVLLALASIGLFIVAMSNSNPNAAQLNPALNSPSSNSVPSTAPTSPNSLLSPSPPTTSSGSDDGGSQGGG